MTPGLAISLALCGYLLGAGPAADEAALPPAEPAPLIAPAAEQQRPPTLVVRVVHVSPAGAVVPAVGEEVNLERWSRSPGPMGPQPTLAEAWIGRTDATGRVGFEGPPLAMGESMTASVVREGIPFRSASLDKLQPGMPVEIRLYDIIEAMDALKGSYQLDLGVRDGFLIVEGTLYLENNSRQVVVARPDAQGLRFPVPLPAVFGDSLDQGMLPPETTARHMSLNTEPKNGRMAFRDGAVWYDGPLFPGVKQTIQLRYALPITDERMDLAFRSAVPLTSLMISSMWSDRVAPRVVPNRSFVVREGRRGENIQRLIRVDDLPPVGTSMVLRVDHLPRPLVVQSYVAGIGVLLLLAAFALAVISGRMRDV